MKNPSKRVSALVEHYVGYVARRARVDRDDIRQELYIAYMRVEASFKEALGDFEHLLVKSLKNKSVDLLRDHYHSERYGKREVVLEEMPEVPVTAHLDARLHLEDRLSLLTPRQREIVLQFLNPGRSLQNEWYSRELRAQQTRFRPKSDAVAAITGTSRRICEEDMQEIHEVFETGAPASNEQKAWLERLRNAQCAQHSENPQHIGALKWKRVLLESKTARA